MLLIFNLACEGKKEFNTVTRCVEEITETGSTCSQEWRITDIDSADAKPDIAIDSGDNIHIVFDKKYVTNVSGNWQKFIVFPEEFKVLDPTIVIDSGGNKHIFAVEYIDDEPRRLQHAKGELGNWNISIIDLGEDVRWYSANLDSKDNIHIVYSGLSGGVSYATNLSGQWEKYFIDEGNWGVHMDSVIDQKDNIHIAYLDKDLYLIYATNSTGGWVKYVLDKGFCCEDGLFGPLYARPSITLSTEGHIYINYLSEKYSEYNQALVDYKYITNASGEWESHSFPYYGDFDMPMVIDSIGGLHIAFGSGSVHYLTNSSGEWKHYIIEKGEKILQWDSADIERDNNNNIHIVYSGEDGTKYATNR